MLREVNPDVADLVPKLVYLLKASMGKLGEGLRLLPLSNISAKGEPIITASKPGELGASFRFTEGGPVHELLWHAPLTAVAGAKRCPKDGEPLDASWSYCPWHGVKLESSREAEALGRERDVELDGHCPRQRLVSAHGLQRGELRVHAEVVRGQHDRASRCGRADGRGRRVRPRPRS